MWCPGSFCKVVNWWCAITVVFINDWTINEAAQRRIKKRGLVWCRSHLGWQETPALPQRQPWHTIASHLSLLVPILLTHLQTLKLWIWIGTGGTSKPNPRERKKTGLSWEPHQTVQLLKAAIDFQVEEVYTDSWLIFLMCILIVDSK